MTLSVLIFERTKHFPKEEQYGLTSQIRRAAFSIPSNIAEGFSRGGKPEFRHFLQIGFASGAELETELTIASKIGFLTETDYNSLMELLNGIMKMLNKMISNIRKDTIV